MKVRKIAKWDGLNVSEKADFIGKRSEGFKVVSERFTRKGVIEVVYSYDSWDFNVTVLLVPILDSGYCQIVEVENK